MKKIFLALTLIASLNATEISGGDVTLGDLKTTIYYLLKDLKDLSKQVKENNTNLTKKIDKTQENFNLKLFRLKNQQATKDDQLKKKIDKLNSKLNKFKKKLKTKEKLITNKINILNKQINIINKKITLSTEYDHILRQYIKQHKEEKEILKLKKEFN